MGNNVIDKFCDDAFVDALPRLPSPSDRDERNAASPQLTLNAQLAVLHPEPSARRFAEM